MCSAVDCEVYHILHNELYMYDIKRIRNLVANTVVFCPGWQHGCELNLRATSQGALIYF